MGTSGSALDSAEGAAAAAELGGGGETAPGVLATTPPTGPSPATVSAPGDGAPPSTAALAGGEEPNAVGSVSSVHPQPSRLTKAIRPLGSGTGSSTTKGASLSTVICPEAMSIRTAWVRPSTSWRASTASGPHQRGE